MYRLRTLLVVFAAVGCVVAAPVPKSLKRSKPVTLTLVQNGQHPDVFTLTLQNHTDARLTWRSTTIPLAAFTIDLTDERGQAVPVTHPAMMYSPFAPPGNETVVDAGKGYFMEFRLSRLLNDAPRPAGNLRLTVTFEHDGSTFRSDPLEVK